ncbi:hypothetical protein GPJ56_004094 [Histomonas meleagridis]|nr:hypothetical protein GPJ56_004094 [Histomonas meleagridis]
MPPQTGVPSHWVDHWVPHECHTGLPPHLGATHWVPPPLSATPGLPPATGSPRLPHLVPPPGITTLVPHCWAPHTGCHAGSPHWVPHLVATWVPHTLRCCTLGSRTLGATHWCHTGPHTWIATALGATLVIHWVPHTGCHRTGMPPPPGCHTPGCAHHTECPALDATRTGVATTACATLGATHLSLPPPPGPAHPGCHTPGLPHAWVATHLGAHCTVSLHLGCATLLPGSATLGATLGATPGCSPHLGAHDHYGLPPPEVPHTPLGAHTTESPTTGCLHASLHLVPPCALGTTLLGAHTGATPGLATTGVPHCLSATRTECHHTWVATCT